MEEAKLGMDYPNTQCPWCQDNHFKENAYIQVMPKERWERREIDRQPILIITIPTMKPRQKATGREALIMSSP